MTARPWRWMTELWAYVGSRGLAVVSNGALLLDVATGQPLEVHGIEREVGLPLVERDPARPCRGVRSRSRCSAGIALEPDYREPGHAPPGSPRGDLAEVWDRTGAQAPGPQHRRLDPAAFRDAGARRRRRARRRRPGPWTG